MDESVLKRIQESDTLSKSVDGTELARSCSKVEALLPARFSSEWQSVLFSICPRVQLFEIANLYN
jgi:hypothetical protein